MPPIPSGRPGPAADCRARLRVRRGANHVVHEQPSPLVDEAAQELLELPAGRLVFVHRDTAVCLPSHQVDPNPAVLIGRQSERARGRPVVRGDHGRTRERVGRRRGRHVVVQRLERVGRVTFRRRRAATRRARSTTATSSSPGREKPRSDEQRSQKRRECPAPAACRAAQTPSPCRRGRRIPRARRFADRRRGRSVLQQRIRAPCRQSDRALACTTW